jgi:uncharacterized protein YggE
MNNKYISDKENVISVTGYGRLFISPNYLTISASISCCTADMKASFMALNNDMKDFFEIVNRYEIDKKHVQVVDLDFGPEYKYENGLNKFLGHKVTQRVNIELDATKENQEKAKRILGLIPSLKYLHSCDISYGLRNKKKYLEQVRELSFKNATEKAEQYAQLSHAKIIKINSITDKDAVGEYSRGNSSMPPDDIDLNDDSILPNGQKIVLENRIYVTFDIGVLQ